jgi:hypothetical protein
MLSSLVSSLTLPKAPWMDAVVSRVPGERASGRPPV